MMKKKLLSSFALMLSLTLFSQIGIKTPNPHPSSDLELASANKALLLNRVEKTVDVANPTNGMIIYDKQNDCFKGYAKGVWTKCFDGATDPSVAANCNQSGFSGNIVSGGNASGVTFSVTVTNNSFSTAGISFNISDLVLSDTGLSVASVSPATASLGAGGSQVITYTLSGTPTTNVGSLITATWTKLYLTCSNSTTVISGSIGNLECTTVNNAGTINTNVPIAGVSSTFSYIGGNGGSHPGQSVNSTGITGLTATLLSGNFANGSGTLTYNITGTPSGTGTASFAINIGGKTCTLQRTVTDVAASTFTALAPTYNGQSAINTLGVGYYDKFIPAESTIQVQINVTQVGSYNLTGTASGITYSAAGVFSTLGNQYVTFTPITSVRMNSYGTKNITLSGTGVSNTKIISPRIDVLSVSNAKNWVEGIDFNTISAGGRVWMDRNLGAQRAATSAGDIASYGNSYQWGRFPSGYQQVVRNGDNGTGKHIGGTTAGKVGVGFNGQQFVTGAGENWSSTNPDNLWSSVNSTNNPCPSGYRVPTRTEINNSNIGNSNFPSASMTERTTGNVQTLVSGAVSTLYWLSEANNSGFLERAEFKGKNNDQTATYKASGLPVRCIKN